MNISELNIIIIICIFFSLFIVSLFYQIWLYIYIERNEFKLYKIVQNLNKAFEHVKKRKNYERSRTCKD